MCSSLSHQQVAILSSCELGFWLCGHQLGAVYLGSSWLCAARLLLRHNGTYLRVLRHLQSIQAAALFGCFALDANFHLLPGKFTVNQHRCICHNNPYDRDPLTNQLHSVCTCSSINISDPSGRSTVSEANKFDDMMYHLAGTSGGCR